MFDLSVFAFRVDGQKLQVTLGGELPDSRYDARIAGAYPGDGPVPEGGANGKAHVYIRYVKDDGLGFMAITPWSKTVYFPADEDYSGVVVHETFHDKNDDSDESAESEHPITNIPPVWGNPDLSEISDDDKVGIPTQPGLPGGDHVVVRPVGGDKNFGCKVVPYGAILPAIYTTIYGPATKADCERWMAENCIVL